mgnify:CR=1 FL=1
MGSDDERPTKQEGGARIVSPTSGEVKREVGNAGNPGNPGLDDLPRQPGIADTGEILEIDRPKRLVIKWRNEFMPELKAEGWARCTIELEPAAESVKLTVIHEIDKTGSRFIEAVSGGWPKILSGLKSLLETGKPLGDLAPGPK